MDQSQPDGVKIWEYIMNHNLRGHGDMRMGRYDEDVTDEDLRICVYEDMFDIEKCGRRKGAGR